MKYKILFLFFVQITFSQVDETKNIMKQANDAFLASDFKLAKELYQNSIKLDPNNKDAWYNLAVAEFNLNENENACEHLYNVYKLGDYLVHKEILKNCPDFRNGTIFSIADVQEKPKFIYEEKEYFLFKENVFNPVFVKILAKEISKSKLLKDKLKGRTIVNFGINRTGFDLKIVKYATATENENAIKSELTTIFMNLVKYIPAKNKGEYVDLWERWVMPISL